MWVICRSWNPGRWSGIVVPVQKEEHSTTSSCAAYRNMILSCEAGLMCNGYVNRDSLKDIK
jgi:hypothetical protein